uniref:Uncharacterized protein n=1 Tax=Fagus sylvatica TaxID=28930 RepID=A0A2N9F5P5_FAGSY
MRSIYFLVVVVLAAKTMVSKVKGCELAVIGGGCPDYNACVETCRPCFRGIGSVAVYCRPAGGGIPYDQCVCRMKHGAPCDPPAPPQCPRPWPPHAATASNLNEQTHV